MSVQYRILLVRCQVQMVVQLTYFGTFLFQACKNKACVDSSFLRYDCTSTKCHDQGVSISTMKHRVYIIERDLWKANTQLNTHTNTHTHTHIHKPGKKISLIWPYYFKILKNTNKCSYLIYKVIFLLFQVCNNKKHCHCNPTYLPPNCEYSVPGWEGGSIDSGNFPPSVPPGLTGIPHLPGASGLPGKY